MSFQYHVRYVGSQRTNAIRSRPIGVGHLAFVDRLHAEAEGIDRQIAEITFDEAANEKPRPNPPSRSAA